MIYKDVVKAEFISRPNRFIAICLVNGTEVKCHVRNTGRCREILTPGTTVLLEHSDSPKRKTAYSLIAAYKEDMLINIDSQAPNKLVKEWLERGDCIDECSYIKPEYNYGNSRLDFYAQVGKTKHLIEVKGVTLEDNGLMLFPDAPTERGTRHIHELIDSLDGGYIPHIIFVAQLEKADSFTANIKNDHKFAEALHEAYLKGVDIRVVLCSVAENSIVIPSDPKFLNLVSI